MATTPTPSQMAVSDVIALTAQLPRSSGGAVGESNR